MKKHLLLFAIIISSINAYAQIDDNEVCDYYQIPSVDEFKSNLQLNIEITEISIGKKIEKIDFQYSEEMSDESSVIVVRKDIAIRISIGRVIENGNRYYIYNMKIFKRTKDCWEDTNPHPYWKKFNLGKLTNGYTTGKDLKNILDSKER